MLEILYSPSLHISLSKRNWSGERENVFPASPFPIRSVTGANSLWVHARYEGGSWRGLIHCHCPYVTSPSWNVGMGCSAVGVEPTRAGKEKPRATFFPYHLYVEWDLWVPQIQTWMTSSILSIILLGCTFCHSLTPPHPPALYYNAPASPAVPKCPGRILLKAFLKMVWWEWVWLSTQPRSVKAGSCWISLLGDSSSQRTGFPSVRKGSWSCDQE